MLRQGRTVRRTGPLSCHYTETLKLVWVQRRRLMSRLQNGDRELHPGDCIVITGVGHAYVAGSEGCRLLVVTIGTRTIS